MLEVNARNESNTLRVSKNMSVTITIDDRFVESISKSDALSCVY